MSKIPEGATHEGQGAVKFWVKDPVPGVGYRFSNQRTDGGPTPWMDSTCGTPLYPIRPIWNGPDDGLPPVGLEVLTEHAGRTFAVKILAYARKDDKTAVMVEETEAGSNKGCLFAWMAQMCEFRQIRTAEQLAAEEREREIGKMLATVNYAPWEAAHYELFAERLYDAGARMPGEGSKS